MIVTGAALVCSRLLFALALLAITTLALLPAPDLPVVSLSDKLNHILAFFVLALLMAAAWPSLALPRQWLTLLGYGVAIELLQSGLSYRHASPADVLANAAGIAAAASCIAACRRFGGDGD